jgi:hypothetical protein
VSQDERLGGLPEAITKQNKAPELANWRLILTRNVSSVSFGRILFGRLIELARISCLENLICIKSTVTVSLCPK